MAPAPSNAKKIEDARNIAKTDPGRAEALLREILSQGPGTSDAALKDFETALLSLGELYRDHNKIDELVDLIQRTRSVLSSFAKAKTAKLGRHDPACAL
jgi:hypothetical protein